MTPRSFWTIIVKIFGLYLVLLLIGTIWQTINIIIVYSSFSSTNYNQFRSSGVKDITLTFNILLVIVYVFLLYCCLFKTYWIVDKLKLDEGFGDEKFDFNFDATVILKTALIIIAGLLLIESVTDLIRQIVTYLKSPIENSYVVRQNRNESIIIVDVVKITIAIFMLTCSRMILNFIALKSKNPASCSES
jgi:hypothetical protein